MDKSYTTSIRVHKNNTNQLLHLPHVSIMGTGMGKAGSDSRLNGEIHFISFRSWNF